MERECDLNSSMEKNKNQNDMNGYEYVKKKKLLNGLTIAKWLNHEKEQIKSQKELAKKLEISTRLISLRLQQDNIFKFKNKYIQIHEDNTWKIVE